MNPSATVRPLMNALAAVQLVLDTWSERGVIIGGVAASLLGRPRYTADVEAPELWTDIAGWLEPKSPPRPRRRRS